MPMGGSVATTGATDGREWTPAWQAQRSARAAETPVRPAPARPPRSATNAPGAGRRSAPRASSPRPLPLPPKGASLPPRNSPTRPEPTPARARSRRRRTPRAQSPSGSSSGSDASGSTSPCLDLTVSGACERGRIAGCGPEYDFPVSAGGGAPLSPILRRTSFRRRGDGRENPSRHGAFRGTALACGLAAKRSLPFLTQGCRDARLPTPSSLHIFTRSGRTPRRAMRSIFAVAAACGRRDRRGPSPARQQGDFANARNHHRCCVRVRNREDGLRRRAWHARYGYGGDGHGCGPWTGHGGGYGGDYGGMGRRGHRSSGGRWALRALFERLDTTPGQEKAILAALDELSENRKGLRDEARQTRVDLAHAVEGGSSRTPRSTTRSPGTIASSRGRGSASPRLSRRSSRCSMSRSASSSRAGSRAASSAADGAVPAASGRDYAPRFFQSWKTPSAATTAPATMSGVPLLVPGSVN